MDLPMCHGKSSWRGSLIFQGNLNGELAWELDHQLEIAMDALRCPPSGFRR